MFSSALASAAYSFASRENEDLREIQKLLVKMLYRVGNNVGVVGHHIT